MLATVEYNKTIHSVINKRPVDAILIPAGEPQAEISAKLRNAQDTLRARLNSQRQNRIFEVGEKVLVKRNRRLDNKLTPLCDERVVEADLGTTVLIGGRVVHKDNLTLGESYKFLFLRHLAIVLSFNILSHLALALRFYAAWRYY